MTDNIASAIVISLPDECPKPRKEQAIKFTTLIPLSRNDGSKVSRKELAAIQAEFWKIFGGMTRDGVTVGD